MDIHRAWHIILYMSYTQFPDPVQLPGGIVCFLSNAGVPPVLLPSNHKQEPAIALLQ